MGAGSSTTGASSPPPGKSGNINTNNNRCQVGPLQAIAPGPVASIVSPQFAIAYRSPWRPFLPPSPSIVFNSREESNNGTTQLSADWITLQD